MHKDHVAKVRRPVKIPSAQRLNNIALHYLSRFAASEGSLRRVLQNRIRKAAMRDAAFAADHAKQAQLRIDIETIIEKHRKTGVLNDAAYAETKTHSLRRSGKSRRVIEQKLQIKGIDKELIAKTLAAKDKESDPETTELKAAHILARRKKLGPYRKVAADATRYQKDIAAIARAGFALSVVRKVLDLKKEDMDGDDFLEAFSDL
jgi:regulatory protein